MRSLLRFFTITFIACSLVRGGVTIHDVEKRDNITLKAPIIAQPSQVWEGVDGTWSTFEIRVGTPPTTYRVLPVTSWQETWVVYGAAAGVCNTTLGVKSNCQESRGGVFDHTKSSTWVQSDQNFLGLNEALGYQGVGQYGFDRVGLGYDNSSGPTLSHQIVAEIVTDYWWFGILGLGFQPTNFTTYGNPQASFADTLYSNGSISSMSWSYTAGAVYRLKSVFGSLIFGGYDASKFVPNDVIFTMTGDNLRDIVVTIRSITSTTSAGNTTLMSTPEFAFIDSSVPELWLPTSVCQEFEKAFGLTLDSKSGRYLLNTTTHTSLKSLNPNITITLANQKSGGKTVDLVLPYAAFDLNITEPVIANTTSYYFPLRRADDEGKYTLGRTFLQETYVTTHYNSRTFNVSQCVFSDNAAQRVVALPATLPSSSSDSNSTSTPPNGGSGKKKLSGGAIAGLSIGIILALLLFAFLIFCLFRRRRYQKSNNTYSSSTKSSSPLSIFSSPFTRKSQDPPGPVHEIDSGKRIENMNGTGQVSGMVNEVDGRDNMVMEKWGIPVMVPQELEAPLTSTPPRTNAQNPNTGAGTATGANGGANGSGEGVGTEAMMAGGRLSPQTTKTPMAEMDAQERGLGEAMPLPSSSSHQPYQPHPSQAPHQLHHLREEEDHIVSPATSTLPSMMGRNRHSLNTSGNRNSTDLTTSGSRSGSPTISEATWTPSTPDQRRGSRFEERFEESGRGL